MDADGLGWGGWTGDGSACGVRLPTAAGGADGNRIAGGAVVGVGTGVGVALVASAGGGVGLGVGVGLGALRSAGNE